MKDEEPSMPAAPNSKTFLLVHGAWHGGWCWRRVSALLTGRGHSVFAPTLTGLGERSHLMNADIRLATHVADVVNVIKWEQLTDVVLVGHSYAGFVISGVAERAPSALASIVFLDAFVPDSGDRLVDLTSQASRDAIELSAKNGDLTVPPRPAAFFQVNEKDRAWIDALCTPHPLATMVDKAVLTGARERVPRKTYIRAQAYPNPGFDAAYDKLASDPSWRRYEVPCGHDVMVDMPEQLAEILQEVA
jgi:pimeloyl-ACP methyl ester carboxylesterase